MAVDASGNVFLTYGAIREVAAQFRYEISKITPLGTPGTPGYSWSVSDYLNPTILSVQEIAMDANGRTLSQPEAMSMFLAR